MKIHDVEQNTDAWRTLRAGKPTASSFKKIVTSTGEPSKSLTGYAHTLAAEIYAGAPMEDAWIGNAWTDRGKEIETQAIIAYELANDIEIQRVGFVTTDDEAYGCSPDGLVGDHGQVEIKCLKAENHVAAIMYYKKHGKSEPDYVQQTQGQIMVTGRPWSDLVFFHPQLPMLVVRQEAILAVQGGLHVGLTTLIKERDVIVQTLKSL